MQINFTCLGAAQNVTGSRHLLEIDGVRLLVDCGLYQERDLRERNWKNLPIPPSSINAVLLTHAHLDHCGWLPRLVKQGFSGKVYCTPATAEIARIVLLDSAHLQVEDAEFKKKRHQREKRKGAFPEEPLYITEDVEKCLPLFQPVKYETPLTINDNIKVEFYDAGHILGSSSIKVTVTLDGQERTIVFSGDLGRPNKPILNDPTIFSQADYVLIESTYGDRVHEATSDIKETLEKIINDTVAKRGNIIIPSFSIERSQEVLYFLNELLMEDKIPHLMTFLDSPMAVRVTEVFENHPELFDEDMIQLIRQHESPFDLPTLTMTRTAAQSKAINHLSGSSIIIAGSGMCNGGRVKHHLVNNISRPESTILFVGYQAVGTLGRLIVDGHKEVRILGQTFPVRANIARIYGFSGHADKNELTSWMTGFKSPPRKVFVVHGEPASAQHFAEHIKTTMHYDVAVPKYQQQFVLD